MISNAMEEDRLCEMGEAMVAVGLIGKRVVGRLLKDL